MSVRGALRVVCDHPGCDRTYWATASGVKAAREQARGCGWSIVRLAADARKKRDRCPEHTAR
jgi:hypothetical protein